MNIEEKAKNKLNDLEKLKSNISEITHNTTGIVFPNLSSKIGDQIINFIKLFTKEKVAKFSEEDLVYLDQIKNATNDYLQITSDLQISTNWFKSVVVDHGDDEFYYPSRLYDIRDRFQKISEQIAKNYGEPFQPIFQNVDFDHSQSSDFKHIIKYLKERLSDNDEYKTVITNIINSIMKKNLYLTKEQTEHLLKSFKEVGDINIEDNEIEINENSTLGSGGFGTVMKGTYLKTSEEVAVKNIRIDRISSSSIFSFLTEIKTMDQIQHPNLLKFVGAKIEFPFRIVTQFCSGKSLFDRLHNLKDIPQLTAAQLTKIAYQVALGMQYLHGKEIVHRDLKTSNILLDEYNNAYVADFGLSGQMKNQEKLISRVGTPNYTAPEILACIHYNSQVDVYSYAIVLWEMLVNRVPFKELQADAIYDHVVRNNWRLPLPQESPNGLKKLITQAWSKNPKERPTFSVIVEWFQKGEIYFTSENKDGSITEGKIDCKSVENEKHCPNINEEYLMKVLHKEEKYKAYFDSVVEFIVKNMDDKIRKKLRDSKILTELAQTPNEYCTSTLLLASSLLDVKDFPEFLQNGGILMFKNALNTHSKESLSGALTFATKIPYELIPQIETSIDSVVNLLGDNNKTPDGIILQLLTRFSYTKVSRYIPYISEFLLSIRLEHIDSQEMFNSFTTLFILCKKYIQDNFLTKINENNYETESIDQSESESKDETESKDKIQTDGKEKTESEAKTETETENKDKSEGEDKTETENDANESKDKNDGGYPNFKDIDYNLKHFLEFITSKYVIVKEFVQSIIEMIGDDVKNIPSLLKNCILALEKSDLTDDLITLIKRVSENHPKILYELARDASARNAIRECLENIKKRIKKLPNDQALIEDRKFQAPLLLLFCIASQENAPPYFSKLEKPDVITSLLEMRKHINQRLQIFTALVCSPEFCSEVQDSRMENIIHLISSSPTSQGQHLSNTALRFILAMSQHQDGCEILEKHDVLDLFVQNFLSSNMDINISYRIIRNVAKNGVELPQMKIIISCLVQSLLYEMSQKETILDTLVALVKKSPTCIQQKDLQDYILFKLEAPIVVLQSLRLLKALNMNKVGTETINNILTHVSQILEKPNYHHPKIINAALAVIKNIIIAKEINIRNFLDQTDILTFAEMFLKELYKHKEDYETLQFEKMVHQAQDFINTCKKTISNTTTSSILNQQIDD